MAYLKLALTCAERLVYPAQNPETSFVTAFFRTGYTGHTVVGPELHGAELGVEGVPGHVVVTQPLHVVRPGQSTHIFAF